MIDDLHYRLKTALHNSLYSYPDYKDSVLHRIIDDLENYTAFSEVYYNYIPVEKVIEHDFGSGLIGTNLDTSDIDLLSLNTYKKTLKYINAQTSYSDIIWTYEKRDGRTFDYGAMSFTLVYRQLNKEFLSLGDATRSVSHLGAIKFNLLTVYNEDIFKEYHNYLLAPGRSIQFWIRLMNIAHQSLLVLPDKEFNWYLNPAQNELYSKTLEIWSWLGLPYPELCKQGYDPLLSKYVFQYITIAKNILENNDYLFSETEKQYIIALKNEELSYKDYLEIKKNIWKPFRKAVESISHRYFLGYGNTIEKSTKYLGTDGDMYILNLFNSGK